MFNIKKSLISIATIFHSRTARIALMVLTIAMFILSAGAPNAMGGIGK